MKYDVIVIGAGPAGAVAAAKILSKGLSVLVLEKQIFPRFVIGESLLPHCMDFLDELNFLPAVSAHGFQVKTGACFYHNNESCDFLFSDKYTPGWDYTYQVKRADFDSILIDECRKQGANVVFQAEVVEVTGEKDNQRIVYIDESSISHTVEARFIVDASGYGRVLPRLKNLDRPVKTPPRAAIFSHVIDSNRSDLAGKNIFINAFKNNEAWIWSIPFSDSTSSVGIVGSKDYIDEISKDNGSEFKELVASFDGLNGRYRGVSFCFEPKVVGNYATSVSELKGDGYVLCGNATEFLDPIFSSGVTLAVVSGYKAGDLVSRELLGETVDWSNDYSSFMKKGIDVFRSYVNAWYDGRLATIFFADRIEQDFKRQICSVLAGYVWDETNPFVAKHDKILDTLAKVIQIQEK